MFNDVGIRLVNLEEADAPVIIDPVISADREEAAVEEAEPAPKKKGKGKAKSADPDDEDGGDDE